MKQSSSGRGFPLFFGGIWSVLTLGFDGGIGYFAYLNLRSNSYVETIATVTASRIDDSRDSDGDTSYRPHIEYDYQVDGRPQHGTVRRYGEMGVSGHGAHRSVQTIIARYPVGGQVPVYYDPRTPATAVLERGLSGTELFLALFLTPFNMIMLAIWSGVISGGSRQADGAAEDSLLKESGVGYEIDFPRIHPVVAFGIGLGGGAFLLIFVIAFTSGFHPSLSSMTTAWSLLLAFAFACSTASLRKTRYFVDPATRQLSITGRWLKPDETVDGATISGISAEKSAVQSDNSPPAYYVQLRYIDGAGLDRKQSIGWSWTIEQAQALAERLRSVLQISTKPDTAEIEPV